MPRPFSCGTQYGDWESRNCANCHLQGYYSDADRRNWVWRCELQRALGEAYIGTGEVSEDVARRVNAGGRCTEFNPIIDPGVYYAHFLKPSPTKLAPLWMRLRRAFGAAYSFWIKPWDRENYDHYEGLRSPWLAWSVAWGIHHDYRVQVCGCGRRICNSR